MTMPNTSGNLFVFERICESGYEWIVIIEWHRGSA